MLNGNNEEIDFPRFTNRQTHRYTAPANNSGEHYRLNIYFFLPFLDH